MALGHFNAYELLAHARYCIKCGNTEVTTAWPIMVAEDRKRTEEVIKGNSVYFPLQDSSLPYHLPFYAGIVFPQVTQ